MSQYDDNSPKSQCIKLLGALKKFPVSTIYAREMLGIMAPAPRVYELRNEQEYNICTFWRILPTADGKLHRVAQYVLLAGKWEGKAL
jgi:hypothetical protein